MGNTMWGVMTRPCGAQQWGHVGCASATKYILNTVSMTGRAMWDVMVSGGAMWDASRLAHMH